MNNLIQFNKNIYDLRSIEIIHFFKYLNKHYSDYAVVGDLSDFPKKITSDIDIYINFKKINEIKNFIKRFSIKRKLNISNILKHEHNSYFFVLSKKFKNDYFYIHIDICNSFTSKNVELMDFSTLKKKKVILQNTYYLTLTKKDNTYYYFIKKVLKGHINNLGYNYLKKNLKSLYSNNLLNLKHKKLISNIFKYKNYSKFIENINILRNIVTKDCKRNYIKELRRIFFRTRFKTGLHVAFIGVDGSGKSTQINHTLKSNLPFFFRGTNVYHLYNKLTGLKNKKIQPYQKTYGRFLSLLKIFYLFSRFLKFYYIDIMLLKTKSFLLINDRCHFDVMIDPKRFGINHSFAILNLIFKFLPKPDVVFFINSSAKNILNRSTELSKKILSKNITNYENFSKKNKFIFNLKSNKTINKVNEIILSKIYNKLNLQTKKIFLNLK
jgi:thymidylate kinase